MRLALAIALTGLLALPAASRAQAPSNPATPEQLVDALEGMFGRNAGLRRAHPKGFCAEGEWVSTGAGAALTTAATLAPGVRAPVLARFSLAGGNPRAPDNVDNARGLAMRLDLPGNESQDFVVISAPVFGVRTPEQFRDNLIARRPDPATGQPDQARIQAFVAANPEVTRQAAWIRANPPSDSYASAPYFGVHSFLFTNAAGQVRPARWSFEPAEGRRSMTPEDRQRLGANFLEAELAARLARGPAEWRVFLTPAQEGDVLTDATLAWPEDRPRVEVARLSIRRVAAADACTGLMFSPVSLPRGIDPSEDPILQMRTPAYAESFSRRSGGQ
ncbi:catalase family peroxidase [Roseomonas sp. PWR1]|uniref:Catalase-related peroxidase n=1 Tax=Roseomonas nitratireducens TaxID=2820810 RepID=A0ABS4AZX3_9PROT|nr:catalase family peroxidase [Neoroseomonas nitratireducens]MBP0466896.1 catalase family peroxidase [Neoroseomonas nitratireducens]